MPPAGSLRSANGNLPALKGPRTQAVKGFQGPKIFLKKSLTVSKIYV